VTPSQEIVEIGPGIPSGLLPGRTDEVIASIIAKAEAFDMTKIRQRYMREYRVARGVADMHECELKRYLAICAILDEEIGMRGDIDQFWHTFIFFTRQYLAFCYLIAGEGNFIHHAPIVQDETPTSQPVPIAAVPRDYFAFWLGYSYLYETRG
jgi:hypothetical protein